MKFSVWQFFLAHWNWVWFALGAWWLGSKLNDIRDELRKIRRGQ